MLTEAINPPKAKTLQEVEANIAKWEEKVKVMKSQFDEKLTNGMKIAIFTNMMTNDLQDFIYTHADKKTDYDELREKVKAMTGNKIANRGPTPMDVGHVGEWREAAWYTDEGNYGDLTIEDEQQIDAVSGHLQCRNCQGYGHFARECPS